MRNKSLSVLSMALVLCGVLVAGSAQAGVVGVQLDSMRRDIPVDGVAQLIAKGRSETFDLRVFTPTLKDGTMLLVSIRRNSDDVARINVAKVEVVLGSALLRLDNRSSVSPVFPLRGVQEIWVTLPSVGDVAHGTVQRATSTR